MLQTCIDFESEFESSPASTGVGYDFARIFEQWVAHREQAGWTSRASRPLREDSIVVYREMWNALAEYCVAARISPFGISSGDLESFLASRKGKEGRALSKPYAFRMLSLVDKVLNLEARLTKRNAWEGAQALLRSPDYRFANDEYLESLPDALTEHESEQLIAWLAVPDLQALPSWKALRDRAAVAVMLGAGLAPGDTRALALEGCKRNAQGIIWKLSVPGDGNGPARESPIAEWASELLEAWLTLRSQLVIPGASVFPGTRNGRSWGKSSLFESVTQLLEDAGYPGRSGMALRHSFALRQLKQGVSVDELQTWLGLKEGGMLDRYRRMVFGPVQVV